MAGGKWQRYTGTVTAEQSAAAEHAEGARVLIVEDEPHIRDLVALHLRLEGLTIVAVGDGNEASAHARSEPFDVIVLDLMLPGLDGVTVCRAIRREPAQQRRPDPDADGPPRGVRQSARPGERRRRLPDEAVRRARAGGACAGAAAPPAGVEAGAWHRRPSPSQFRCMASTSIPRGGSRKLDGREIELTAHEFDLLYLLASNPGIVFSREALVQRVWGGDTHVTDRSVDTLVKRVRRKIEDDRAEPRFILTVWGTGYKFADV